MAFLIGGLICTLGEVILNILLITVRKKEAAGAWASIILVFLSALFTGLGLYEKLAKHAGAGTLVPITGFANAVVSSAIESKSEGLILGGAQKFFTIAGPVILYGTTASVIYGIIYFSLSGEPKARLIYFFSCNSKIHRQVLKRRHRVSRL